MLLNLKFITAWYENINYIIEKFVFYSIPRLLSPAISINPLQSPNYPCNLKKEKK